MHKSPGAGRLAVVAVAVAVVVATLGVVLVPDQADAGGHVRRCGTMAFMDSVVSVTTEGGPSCAIARRTIRAYQRAKKARGCGSSQTACHVNGYACATARAESFTCARGRRSIRGQLRPA